MNESEARRAGEAAAIEFTLMHLLAHTPGISLEEPQMLGRLATAEEPPPNIPPDLQDHYRVGMRDVLLHLYTAAQAMRRQ